MSDLVRLLSGKNAHVNLIPVNPVDKKTEDMVNDLVIRRPEHQYVVNFQNKLEKSGINVTIRREMGRDIDGACGQLRRRHLSEK